MIFLFNFNLIWDNVTNICFLVQDPFSYSAIVWRTQWKINFLTLFFHFIEWWLMSHYLCIFYLLLLVIIYIYCFKNDLAKSVEGIFNLSIYPYLNPQKNVGSFHRIPQCYFIFHITFYRGKRLTFIQPKTRMLFWLSYFMKILLLYSRSSFIHIVLINEKFADRWFLITNEI